MDFLYHFSTYVRGECMHVANERGQLDFITLIWYGWLQGNCVMHFLLN